MSVSLSNSITRRHSVLNDVIENDVMYSWMNMHTLLASRPNVVASTRVDAVGVNGALLGCNAALLAM